MPYVNVLPVEFNRTIASEKLDFDQAAMLQHIDLLTSPGRVIRGKGASRADYEPSASTITAAEVFVRNDCRRIVVDSSLAGTWRANPGRAFGGQPCLGPAPEIVDLEPQDGDTITNLSATSVGTQIIAAVTSGRTYEVYAVGRWQIDPNDTFLTGPEGLGALDIIADIGQPFDGFSYSRFCIKEPGSSFWVGSDGYSIIQVTADGNLLGSMADKIGLFGNNLGYMTVLVRPL